MKRQVHEAHDGLTAAHIKGRGFGLKRQLSDREKASTSVQGERARERVHENVAIYVGIEGNVSDSHCERMVDALKTRGPAATAFLFETVGVARPLIACKEQKN